MTDVFHVEQRDGRGTRVAAKLRQAGKIPAILYGHGRDNVSLTIPVDELEGAIRHGGRMVSLEGAASDSALIREIQWDPFGTHVLHVDLTRVSASELVEISVPVELRGEAPGVREGGQVMHPLHELPIECPASAIPEKLEVSINQLQLNEDIRVSDLELPTGAKPLVDGDTIVAECVPVVEEEDEESAEAVAGEPEVIGRKAEDEAEED